MDIAALVIACLSALGTLSAVWYTRRSAAAARRSADAANEVASIERERREEEIADADRNRVVFHLNPDSGHAYILRNAGTDRAYGVHVDTGGMGAANEQTEFDEFRPGQEHRFLLARTMDPGQADHITVTWHLRADLTDPEQSVQLLGP